MKKAQMLLALVLASAFLVDCAEPGPGRGLDYVLEAGASYFTVRGHVQPATGRNVTGWQLSQFEQIFDWMAAAGSTLARIHVTHGFGIGIDSEGRTDPVFLREWDAVLDAAAERGISVIPVFAVWADWRNEGALWEAWGSNPLNAANGGPAAVPADLLTDGETRNLWANWMRGLVERWAGRWNIAAWELFSEMNLITGTSESLSIDFYRAASAILRSADPLGRPVYASLAGTEGWPAFFALDGMDIVQVHPYAVDLDTELIRVARDLRTRFGKPVLIGECDLDAGPNVPESKNLLPNAIEALRLAAWAGVASGAMNARFNWFHDSYSIYDVALGLAYLEPFKDFEAPAAAFCARVDFRGMVPLDCGASGGIVGACVGSSESVVGWYKSESTAAEAWPPNSVVGSLVSIVGVADGDWTVTFWDTADGTTAFGTQTRSVSDGNLVITFPAFDTDIAFTAER